MSRSKHVAAYPTAMLDLIRLAQIEPTVIIPCPSPAALRLQFYGLNAALRAEKSPLADTLRITLQPEPPAVVLTFIENTAMAAVLNAALLNAMPASAVTAADAALKRILGTQPL